MSHCFFAQFNTPILDGVISPGEYGDHTNGLNREQSGATAWYCTWDADSIYFAIDLSDVTEAAVIYFDFDPVRPVNGGGDMNGTVAGTQDYDRTTFHQPFRSDFGVFIKDTYNEYRFANGSNDWTDPSIAQILTTSVQGNTLEFSIPWNTITGIGRPLSFNWFGFKVYENGGFDGTYDAVPVSNPTSAADVGNGQTNIVKPSYYYTVSSTESNDSIPPFSQNSFTYYQDSSAPGSGGRILGDTTLYDLTIFDNSSDNADNLLPDTFDNRGIANRLLIDGNITIENNLVIGPGSALLPNDNSGGAVNSTISMTGMNGAIYNEGRIDCTPEVGSVVETQDRRLAFVIDGNIRYEESALFKDRARFSDITINNSASFTGPASSSQSAQIELQYGTLTNYGVLDFMSNGNLTFDLRGDNPAAVNNYYLSSPDSSGIFKLNGLLIGRNASVLQPDTIDGGLVTLEVHGDFENYHRFIPKVRGMQAMSPPMNTFILNLLKDGTITV